MVDKVRCSFKFVSKLVFSEGSGCWVLKFNCKVIGVASVFEDDRRFRLIAVYGSIHVEIVKGRLQIVLINEKDGSMFNQVYNHKNLALI